MEIPGRTVQMKDGRVQRIPTTRRRPRSPDAEVLVAEQIRRVHQDRCLRIWPLGQFTNDFRNVETGEIAPGNALFASRPLPHGEWQRVELRASLVELLGEDRANRLREILQYAPSFKRFSTKFSQEEEMLRGALRGVRFLPEGDRRAAEERRCKALARIREIHPRLHRALFSEPEGRPAGSPNSAASERSREKRKRDAERRTLAIAAADWMNPDTPESRRAKAREVLEKERGLFGQVDARTFSHRPLHDADEIVGEYLGDKPSTVKHARLTEN